MATPFGKEIRKMRIDRTLSLREMAQSLEVTSAYLSAVETGRRPITDNLFKAVVDFFQATESELETLKKARDASATDVTFSLNHASDSAKETMVAFARSFKNLSDADIKKIRLIIKSQENYDEK